MLSAISWSRTFLHPIAAAAISLPLLVPAAGATQRVRTAEPPPPLSLDEVCPEGFETPDDDFTDIGTDGPHVRAIRCAAHHGVTAGGPGGRPATQYGPSLDVTREQQASFIARLVDIVDAELDAELLPAWDGENDFDDVDPTSTHVEAINRLADAGIVRGGPGGRPDTSFGPALGVTRAQVASLLNRMHATVAGGSFVSQDVYFDDLGGVIAEHAQHINALAEEGVLVGRAFGDERHYDPRATVRRDQMASLLMRDFGLLAALDVFGHTFVEPGLGSGAAPVISEGFPDATVFAQLVDVDLAHHEEFDRFVLEFDSDEMPAHSVRYVAPPVFRSGSGEPVVLSGDAYLAVDVSGASGFDIEAGVPTYDGPRDLALGDGHAVLEAKETGDFEAMLNWRLGVDVQRPFTVALLTNPTRLVVDVASTCAELTSASPGDGEMTVTVYFGCVTGHPPQDPTAVDPTERVVPERPDVLTASLEELLQGPTDGDRAFGLSSFFSPDSAGLLLGVNLPPDGDAVVDFSSDLPAALPGANTSFGSAALLAELNTTVFQFPNVETVEYRLDGDCDAFGAWLQGSCTVFSRPAT